MFVEVEACGECLVFVTFEEGKFAYLTACDDVEHLKLEVLSQLDLLHKQLLQQTAILAPC